MDYKLLEIINTHPTCPKLEKNFRYVLENSARNANEFFLDNIVVARFVFANIRFNTDLITNQKVLIKRPEAVDYAMHKRIGVSNGITIINGVAFALDVKIYPFIANREIVDNQLLNELFQIF